MGGASEDVAHSMLAQRLLERFGPKNGAAVGEQPLGHAVPHERCPENAQHLGGARPADGLEGDQATPAVVDHAQYPDREEAQDEDEREVSTPEREPALHADASWRASSNSLELVHQVAAPDENLPKRLSARAEAEDARGQMPQLPCSELRLLDMEPDHLLFAMARSAVPSPLPTREGSARDEPGPHEPTTVELPQRA